MIASLHFVDSPRRMLSALSLVVDILSTYTILCWYLVSVTKTAPTPESIFRKRGGGLRMSDALEAGINRKSLYALRDAGTITQLSRDQDKDGWLQQVMSVHGVMARSFQGIRSGCRS